MNEVRNGKSSMDLASALLATQNSFHCFNLPIPRLIDEICMALILTGAKTYHLLKKERNANTDYFKELEYLRHEGTSDKVMPGLTIIR